MLFQLLLLLPFAVIAKSSCEEPVLKVSKDCLSFKEAHDFCKCREMCMPLVTGTNSISVASFLNKMHITSAWVKSFDSYEWPSEAKLYYRKGSHKCCRVKRRPDGCIETICNRSICQIRAHALCQA